MTESCDHEKTTNEELQSDKESDQSGSLNKTIIEGPKANEESTLVTDICVILRRMEQKQNRRDEEVKRKLQNIRIQTRRNLKDEMTKLHRSLKLEIEEVRDEWHRREIQWGKERVDLEKRLSNLEKDMTEEA